MSFPRIESTFSPATTAVTKNMAHTHTHTHTARTHTHEHTHARTHTHERTQIRTQTCTCTHAYIHNTHTYTHAHTHTHTHTRFDVFMYMKRCSKGWRRPIGCLIFIGHVPQKSPTFGGSFAENDQQIKAFYGSLPPCRSCSIPINFAELWLFVF